MNRDTTASDADLGFGIDIGGSGMKAAIVDLRNGDLVTDRHRIPTPSPATPDAMAAVARRLVEHEGWERPLGVAFPAIVRNGIIRSAANIDKSWVGVDVDSLLTEACGADVAMVNDADAAGVAEMRFGAGRDVGGVVIMLTFGTGIGSGLFIDGALVPNTELGHLEVQGHDAESRAAASVRDRHHMSWKKWSKRVETYLRHVEMVFSPDLFIVGGGVSKDADKWVPRLDVRTRIVPAEMQNNAGIVGAALMARPDSS